MVTMADVSSIDPRLDDLRRNLHPFETTHGTHLFVADGSRIYDLSPRDLDDLHRLLEGDAPDDVGRRASNLAGLLLPVERRYIDARPIAPPPVQSLSLNVAQACNMSCGYCYAAEGTFGGNARLMTFETARASVDRLFQESAPGHDVLIGFIGGEPLLARRVVHEVTRYAADEARRQGRTARFSITTNGTLLTAEDCQLFRDFPFTVTVSVDGPPDVHRRLRMLHDGGDAYERLRTRLELFAQHGRPRELTARMTVTPQTHDLSRQIGHVIALGFDHVGVSPVIVSADPTLAYTAEALESLLDQMIECGTRALDHACAGEPYPFDNFETAMREIHRGTHRPYPCGAGAAYLSVNAGGELYACHRLIDDAAFAMGDVWNGPDQARRTDHLRVSHVDRAEPCRDCWARYLCGGGCYHEVSRRGRVACDYIRGWLHFCLTAYVRLQDARPDYFGPQTRGGDHRG